MTCHRANDPLHSSPIIRVTLFKATFFIVSLMLLFAFAALPTANAQVVAQYDFEDGTTQGWGAFCGATVVNTTAAAESGTHSLLVSGRTQNCAGPSINLVSLLLPGATYQITGWVELTSGETGTDQANFTIQQVDSASGTNYVTVGPYTTNVTDSGWVELSGQYVVSSSPTTLNLYTQLVNSGSGATDSFYLDNVTITEIAPPPGGPQDNSGISTNFEDGYLDGWEPRFDTITGQVPTATSSCCTLTNTTADAHGGTHSVLVTGRSAAYEGPQISVSNKMYVGSNYAVSIWVKLGPSATAPDTLRVSLQTTSGGVTSYNTVVGNTTVPLNTWVNLSNSNFSMSYAYDPGQAFLYVESNGGIQSGTTTVYQDFYIDDFTLTYIPPLQIEQNIASVYQTYANYFPIGAAIDGTDLFGPHSQLLVKHFNSITSENDMKWDATEATEGTFTFTNADAEVAFAQKNNIRIRGHNLVWATGEQVPAWVFLEEDGVTPLQPGNAADAALLTQRIQNHIQNVVSHFGNAVYAWDVVNEPIDPSQPDCLYHGPFYNILGAQYIDLAFQFARAANPNAELFLNDYNTTTSKQACLYQVVQGLIARGVPIDAVGHEMHSNIQYPPTSSITQTVNMFNGLTTVAGKPLDQQITELDMSIYAGSNPTIYTDYSQIPDDLLVDQGYLYRDYFQAFKALAGKISSVTFWGMADDDTWLTSSTKVDAPLLFDNKLQHEYAYTGIIDPLNLPGANLVTTIAASSGTVLSGQSVSFVITITNNGPNDAASLTFTDSLPAATTFQSFAAPSGWACTLPTVGGTGAVSCTAATLTNGSAVQFTLTLGVLCATPNGSAITDSATVTSTTLNPNPTPQNSASVTIATSDPAPVISGLSVSRPFLWPPAGEFVPEWVQYGVTATCDLNPKLALSVSVNQKDRDANRDYKVINPHLVWLEAERTPLSQERIYTITVTATDSAGSSGSGSVDVKVLLFPDQRDEHHGDHH